jgi:DNA-directed RNA polymerase subunit F
MSNPVILEESSVPFFVVKEVLEKNKERGELNFRANKTLEYLQNVSVVKKKEGEKLIKELHDLQIPRMKDAIIHKLVDTLPGSIEELKGILSAYTLTVTKEHLEKIVEVVNKK